MGHKRVREGAHAEYEKPPTTCLCECFSVSFILVLHVSGN